MNKTEVAGPLLLSLREVHAVSDTVRQHIWDDVDQLNIFIAAVQI